MPRRAPEPARPLAHPARPLLRALIVAPVVKVDALLAARRVVDAIYIDDKVKRDIVSLVVATLVPRILDQVAIP